MWQERVHKTEAWYDNDINFGVPEESKKMLEENRVTTPGEIKD
jgi:hypothetical protein